MMHWSKLQSNIALALIRELLQEQCRMFRILLRSVAILAQG